MNLVFRLVIILIRCYLSPKRSIHQTSKSSFRAWPHDFRLRDHLPNQRFFNIMELGRFPLWHGARLALAGQFSARMIAAQQLIYIKPIGRLKHFDVYSRIAGWDGKYIYYHQEFHSGDTLFATGLVKEACLKKGRLVSPEDILGDAQPLPEVITTWLNSQQALKTESFTHSQEA
ncbi:thioesterase family protein [Parendozoicomonas sp. Alg238-R29]|uniref:thioesterase family protein n=1 Tax=Parendozoicomonas sp. Alg238-R29 TaxID=2993446 RepID=UPI00248E845E|nr:thioesterase family protein [Parendozoicomonas sp. Alg238-R29]